MVLTKPLRTCLAAFAAFLCLASPAVFAQQQVPVQPRGEYAQIDVRLVNETMAALLGPNADLQQRTILQVKQQPEKFAPPVFYALSGALMQRGEKDDAAFWFYAGQLRARFDANRCADVSARQAVNTLTHLFGQDVNRHAFQDIPKLEALIPRVVEWDRQTPHRYDHRWINLHGMNAILASEGATPQAPAALSAPQEEWERIAEKTRQDYLEGFREAMTRFKPAQK